MMTIQLDQLARVTGGAPQAPRPVPPPPPPNVPASSVIQNVRSAVQAGGAQREMGAAWVGWGQGATGDGN